MSLRDYTPGDLANLRVAAVAFVDTPLWIALRGMVETDLARILTDLRNIERPMEKLKVSQGEHMQASRDIMLVERFLEAVDKAQSNRRMAEERRG